MNMRRYRQIQRHIRAYFRKKRGRLEKVKPHRQRYAKRFSSQSALAAANIASSLYKANSLKELQKAKLSEAKVNAYQHYQRSRFEAGMIKPDNYRSYFADMARAEVAKARLSGKSIGNQAKLELASGVDSATDFMKGISKIKTEASERSGLLKDAHEHAMNQINQDVIGSVFKTKAKAEARVKAFEDMLRAKKEYGDKSATKNEPDDNDEPEVYF